MALVIFGVFVCRMCENSSVAKMKITAEAILEKNMTAVLVKA